MPNRTTIEWCTHNWNPIKARDPVTGKVFFHCEHASEGCRICYSEALNLSFGTRREFTRQNRDLVDIFLDEKTLNEPQPKRIVPAKIFMNDMTDMFGEFVLDDWLDRIFAIVARHPQHIYQVLTKRPERQRDYFLAHLTPFNLWVGTSIEMRRYLDRLDALRATPAAVRFLSLEPLLEDLGELDLTGIHWVITGAESGRGARPMRLDWVRGIRDQCIAASVPFFFKQDAANGKKLPLPELDGRQWRQFPIA
jgi:protein gp37